MKEMPNTDWPAHDYERYESVNEDWCREACLSDCFCDVTFYSDGMCWKKGLPLANGKIDSTLRGKALIKVRKVKKEHSHRNLTNLLLLAGSVCLNLLFLLIICLCTLWIYHKRSISKKVEPKMLDMNLQTFTYKELQVATDQFKEELGRGASATVYKGVLPSGEKTPIAVKKLERIAIEGEKEFSAEVKAIGRTNHKNLVQLLGFCDEGQHRLLVYEFVSNGSLAKFLFESSRPQWSKRIQLACGIASGLTYLHEECNNPIIHCDIKPQNILFDEYFTARISDFGLAKLLKSDQSQTNTGIRGTRGYLAPEWFRNMSITVKVDVYSFSILLLEIICCRRSVATELRDENKVILTDWAYDCFLQARLDVLVENNEEAMDDVNRLEKLVMVAIWCIQEEASLRPTMRKVTQMLEGAVEVSVPPNPSSFLSSIHG